jgi:hypothetical protein
MQNISPGYFHAAGSALLARKSLHDGMTTRSAPRVAIVNQRVCTQGLRLGRNRRSRQHSFKMEWTGHAYRWWVSYRRRQILKPSPKIRKPAMFHADSCSRPSSLDLAGSALESAIPQQLAAAMQKSDATKPRSRDLPFNVQDVEQTRAGQRVCLPHACGDDIAWVCWACWARMLAIDRHLRYGFVLGEQTAAGIWESA